MKPLISSLSRLVFTFALGTLPLPLAFSDQAHGWTANPEVILKAQRSRPEFLFEEEGVPAYTLPPLLEQADGSPITSAADWESHRNHLLDLFREHVYGHAPERPESMSFQLIERNEQAFDGKATLEHIAVHSEHEGRSHTMDVILYLPNNQDRPVPVFLFINNRRPLHTDPAQNTRSEFWPAQDMIARGYGAAAFHIRSVSPDRPHLFQNGVINLFEGDRYQGDPEKRPNNAWGTISAWSWGASRVMDYLQSHPQIDPHHIALVGHSRAGKAALWAVAQDERFALAVSNDSGCAGASLSRRQFGETVKRINEYFPHWFCRNFHSYADLEHELPVDQHMLIALIAPRAVYISSADEDLWADPRGEYLSLAHASPVFALYGYNGLDPDNMPSLNQLAHAGPQAYRIRNGVHDLTSRDWHDFMDWTDSLWSK